MCHVVDWFDQKYVRQEDTTSARSNDTDIGEEHGREQPLQWDLRVHMQQYAHEIVVALALELFLRELIEIVVLVEEMVVKRQRQTGGNYPRDTDGVYGIDWHAEEVTKECWPKEPQDIMACVADFIRVR